MDWLNPNVGRHDWLPVIGVCGSSGAGKTTLIEAMIPLLIKDGLRLAVVKHGAHGVRVDRPGKDSDRFFQAGADVALFGEEHFFRTRCVDDFPGFLHRLAMRYDLILVEGHASTPVDKIWLLGQGHKEPPPDCGEVLLTLAPSERHPRQVAQRIRAWLAERLVRVPLYGCVLIGGRSSRMGRPKHLIEDQGQTWLERTVHCLAPRVEQVVLSGRGAVPESCSGLVRIPDAPGLAGPLAGILAVMRWQPEASWLVVACDQPTMEPEALKWLLAQRCPGSRAVFPDLSGDGRVEPLLAWYDHRCRMDLEAMASHGCLRLSSLADTGRVLSPVPPAELRPSWLNINTPAELDLLPDSA